MTAIIIFLLFVFVFWLIHIAKRLFEHTYLWQVKEYRWDRVKAHLKDSKALRKSVPSYIAIVLSIFGILLLKFIQVKFLYVVVVLGFGYFVYSSLVTITRILNKKLTRPALKSIRNALIMLPILVATLAVIFIPLKFYNSIIPESGKQQIETEPAEVFEFFPTENSEGITTIPLETATVVVSFALLFLFDLLLPLFVALLVAATSIFSTFLRKKK